MRNWDETPEKQQCQCSIASVQRTDLSRLSKFCAIKTQQKINTNDKSNWSLREDTVDVIITVIKTEQ